MHQAPFNLADRLLEVSHTSIDWDCHLHTRRLSFFRRSSVLIRHFRKPDLFFKHLYFSFHWAVTMTMEWYPGGRGHCREAWNSETIKMNSFDNFHVFHFCSLLLWPWASHFSIAWLSISFFCDSFSSIYFWLQILLTLVP